MKILMAIKFDGNFLSKELQEKLGILENNLSSMNEI